MKNRFIILLFLLISISISAQQKEEIRAAWLTGLYGLDWPKTQAKSKTTQEQQKKELCELLDKLQRLHFNIILFQTRMRGDVAYHSSIEPFNEIFTGKEGGNPGYDPLAFAINECHKRGMECHAWIVTLPLGNRKHVSALKKATFNQRALRLCITENNNLFLNPANPNTINYLSDIVREIVTNYDVDGVLFDYLRYPEEVSPSFDRKDYRLYGNKIPLDDWRRNNITQIVRSLYHEIKSIKPWVKVSTCPVGKYRDAENYSPKGFNAFYTVKQDPQAWMKEGIQDIIFPMMYFKGNLFHYFAKDWKGNAYGRYVVPALGIYFLDRKEGNWQIDEIEDQIDFIRNNHLAGESMFRAQYLTNNMQHLSDRLMLNYYTTPSIVPPLHWIDSIPPTVPTNLQIQRKGLSTMLTWTHSSDNDTRNLPNYIVYGSDAWPVDTSTPKNILAIRVADNTYTYNKEWNLPIKRYFAITAIDRYGNESNALQQTRPHVPIPPSFNLLKGKL
jgi:uncharacterized lipoprotein YddW (UPF0748 family)